MSAMSRDEAIYEYATFILKRKKDVVDFINRGGYGSLNYDSPIAEVNKIAIENLGNDDFTKGMSAIQNEGYVNLTGIEIAIVVAIIAVTTTATIWHSNVNARKVRDELIKEQYRSQYLKKEELNEIAYLERERLSVMFLNAQSDYIQKEENYQAQKKLEGQQKMVMIVAIGVTAVIVSAAIMRK